KRRLGVAPGEGKSRNLRERARFFGSDALCARDGSPAGRGGISRDDVIVSDRTTLNVTFRAPGAVGENFSFRVSVFGRIGIDEQCRDSFSLGRERLEAAITVGIRIADENDLALYADTVFSKEIVIFGIAAMRV